MNIVSNDKFELKYDEYEMAFIMTIYDKYGHYVEDVELTTEEVDDLYESLKKFKESEE